MKVKAYISLAECISVSLITFTQWALFAKFGEITQNKAITPFKVIQSH